MDVERLAHTGRDGNRRGRPGQPIGAGYRMPC